MLCYVTSQWLSTLAGPSVFDPFVCLWGVISLKSVGGWVVTKFGPRVNYGLHWSWLNFGNVPERILAASRSVISATTLRLLGFVYNTATEQASCSCTGTPANAEISE